MQTYSGPYASAHAQTVLSKSLSVWTACSDRYCIAVFLNSCHLQSFCFDKESVCLAKDQVKGEPDF